MTQKEQKEILIELLSVKFPNMRLQDAHSIADHLLANAVIVPPCKIGTHLWRVTKPYRQDPKVTEFVVKNFRTTGKKHRLQIEVQAVNVPVTNWMRFNDFHTSKAEAERELAERSKS